MILALAVVTWTIHVHVFVILSATTVKITGHASTTTVNWVVAAKSATQVPCARSTTVKATASMAAFVKRLLIMQILLMRFLASKNF